MNVDSIVISIEDGSNVGSRSTQHSDNNENVPDPEMRGTTATDQHMEQERVSRDVNQESIRFPTANSRDPPPTFQPANRRDPPTSASLSQTTTTTTSSVRTASTAIVDVNNDVVATTSQTSTTTASAGNASSVAVADDSNNTASVVTLSANAITENKSNGHLDHDVTFATGMTIDERIDEEKKEDDDIADTVAPWTMNRRDPPTSSEISAVSVHGQSIIEVDVVIPTLPTGEIVDAKNTVQSHSILAAVHSTTNNANTATQPQSRRMNVPRNDGPLDGGHEKWNMDFTPLAASSMDHQNTILTADAVDNIGTNTSNDMLVHARYLPDEDDGGVVDMPLATTTNPTRNTTATTVTPIHRMRLYLLLILIAVLLVGGIVFAAVCASNNCFAASSNKKSKEPRESRPGDPTLPFMVPFSPVATSSTTSQAPTFNPTDNVANHPTGNTILFPTNSPTETALPTPAQQLRTDAVVAYMNNVTLLGRMIAGPSVVGSNGYIFEQSVSWLIFDDPLQLSPDTPSSRFRMRQRYALRILWRQRPSVGSWINVSGWNTSSENECEWYGIECTSIWFGGDVGQQEAVTKIDLGNVSFNGILPADLGLLSSLLYIDMSFNNLKGTLPSTIGNWQNVTYADLSYNQLNGTFPISIGTNWTNLESASFHYNSFTGTVPMNWCQLASFDDLRADCVSEVICECCDECF